MKISVLNQYVTESLRARETDLKTRSRKYQ